MPTSEDDGITELMNDVEIMNSLNYLDNVSIRNVQDGRSWGILEPDDVWINLPDQVLSQHSFGSMLMKFLLPPSPGKGYLKSLEDH